MTGPMVWLTEHDVLVLRAAAQGAIDARGTGASWRTAVKRLTRMDMLTSGSPFAASDRFVQWMLNDGAEVLRD